MTDIEKTTIGVPRMIMVVLASCSILITVFGVYFAAMNGVRDGFELRDKKDAEQDQSVLSLGYENKLQNIAIEGNKDGIKQNYELLMTHIEKCENPNLKMYKK